MEIIVGTALGSFFGTTFGLICVGLVVNAAQQKREQASLAALNDRLDFVSKNLTDRVNEALAAEALQAMSDIPQPKASA
jgi:hypothetical protein